MFYYVITYNLEFKNTASRFAKRLKRNVIKNQK